VDATHRRVTLHGTVEAIWSGGKRLVFLFGENHRDRDVKRLYVVNALSRLGPQILWNMFVCDAAVSIKCIRAGLRVIESPVGRVSAVKFDWNLS
jgi:hypothetical protein